MTGKQKWGKVIMATKSDSESNTLAPKETCVPLYHQIKLFCTTIPTTKLLNESR